MTAPPLNSDYFTFFGFPRRLKIDNTLLQKRFYELSREFHPDRAARHSAAAQQQALDATALLNDAYRTLRDPVKRAEYLLTQEGLDIGEQRSNHVPPELLEEVFDLNMALEEMRSGDDSARPQLEEARAKFVATLRELDEDLEAGFDRYDASAKDALQTMRGILNRRRYIQNLIRDVNKALE